MPYAPIAEAIKTLGLAADPDELRRDLGGGGPVLAQLVPALRRMLPELPEAVALQPGEERARLLDSLTRLLTARSVRAPVLVCLDDLQWADKGTTLMLAHLARFAAGHRLLVLGTYRPAEVGRCERDEEERGPCGCEDPHVEAPFRSARASSTQALCPPSPIAFERATSTFASRASFGT